MYFSQSANRVSRSNLLYCIEIYGTMTSVYFPVNMVTIRADYDLINYNDTPDYEGKVLINSVFKNKSTNLSILPFTPIDDENAIYSTLEFPIGSLIALRLSQKIQNYQVNNIQKIVDNDEVYFYKYVLTTYTLTNSVVNHNDALSETEISHDEIVTNLSSQVEINQFEKKPELNSVDSESNRPLFISRIIEK